MSYKGHIFIISLIIISHVSVAAATQVKFDQLSPAETAKALGWIKDKDSCNICGGHYFEPSNIINIPEPQALVDAPMDITAVAPAFFAKHGMSVVQGDVVLRQPGREVFADKVTFLRDDKTGKLTTGVLYGNVKFREYGKLFVADRGDIDFSHKIYSIDHGVYRLLTNTPTGLENIWGRAKHAVRNAAGVLKLKRATYSACPPDATTWRLWSNNLTLDRNTGRGEATNAVIFLKKIPILYTPYFNFPIDARRKSGFLTPAPSSSKVSGYGINIPYYFNLAPNYDAIFTPTLFTKSGVLFDGLFRYLTPNSVGQIDVSYIPYDRSFVEFRDTAAFTSGSNYNTFRDLKNSASGRGYLSLKNESHFDASWRGSLNVNYATDSYFLQDFNVTAAGEKDQLLNRADVNYSSDRWNFLGRLQIFQTLHQITQQETKDQYMRLPQLNLSGDYPDGFGGLDYRLDSEIINFMYRGNIEYVPPLATVSEGVRFNLMPSVSAPFDWLGANITPKIQLQTTSYGIYDKLTTINATADSSITKVYPLFSIDSSAVLKKEISFFSKPYTQTLEPRLFYLLVPARNQDNVPIFDTYLPAFDFNQLFRTNRFSGIDRVGDAHQVALAVTTRFLDEDGQEKLNAGLGQIVVMHKHKVVLGGGNVNIDPLRTENLSPLVGKLQYFIHPQVNTTLDMAWDPNCHRLNTVNANLQYIKSADRVVNFWYHYTLHGDQLLQGQPINLSRVGSSVGWKIWQYWRIIGSLNYNASYKRVQNYLYGVEYDSCCWAMRIASSRNFIGIGNSSRSNYDSRYYVQFLLKGLGDSGDNGLGGLVANQVSGYQSKFIK